MPVNPHTDETRQIEHVRDDLVREFASLPPALVGEQVADVAEHFLRAPVRSFVPVLVRRQARERLRQLAT